ncbi:MAG: tRNA (adenosine(37)-N6)-threonylcarbamoyltransferase complex dimerization subunit type 1 TsaB [Myxococcota bacterium]
MAILCLNTATEYGAIAVAREGHVLGASSWQSSERHGENLFGHIDTVLDQASVRRNQIQGVGVCVGPGKFTSLRVGLSAAKGIALALDVPIFGVSSLRVLARSIETETSLVCVALMNAYRGDLFGGAFRFGGGSDEELVGSAFGSPKEVLSLLADAVVSEPVAFCGAGASSHLDALRRVFPGALFSSDIVVSPAPRALVDEVSHVMRSSGPSDLASLEPTYLRPSDAKLPDKALRVDPSNPS